REAGKGIKKAGPCKGAVALAEQDGDASADPALVALIELRWSNEVGHAVSIDIPQNKAGTLNDGVGVLQGNIGARTERAVAIAQLDGDVGVRAESELAAAKPGHEIEPAVHVHVGNSHALVEGEAYGGRPCILSAGKGVEHVVTEGGAGFLPV